MAIAHDSEAVGAASTTTGAYTTSITPTNPPKGVCVAIAQDGSASDLVTGVTYGGVVLTRRRFNTESTEAGAVYLYWGAGTLPAGTQSVIVTRTGTTNMGAVISTMTVAPGMTVEVDSDATGTSASATNPTWTHTSLVNDVVAYLAIHSGLNVMTNTPATNWTLQTSADVGNFGRGFARRALATAGALAPGWIAGADDFVGSSIAFKEIPIPTVSPDPIHPAKAGRLVNPGREAPQYF